MEGGQQDGNLQLTALFDLSFIFFTFDIIEVALGILVRGWVL